MNAIKRYMNRIERNLHMDKETRRRLMLDLSGDVQGRLEAGEIAEQIIADMGPAEAVADRLNREFGVTAPAKSPWRWLFLAAGLVLALPLVPQLLLRIQQMTMVQGSVGVIGGADGPTAIFVTAGPDPLFGTLAPLLGCAAVFCTLQWPGKGWRRWLPIALAAAGILVWCVQAALLGVALWDALAQADSRAALCATGVLRLFFTSGGFVPVLALAFAIRRARNQNHIK